MENLTKKERLLLEKIIRQGFDKSDSKKESEEIITIADKLELPIVKEMIEDHNIHEYTK